MQSVVVEEPDTQARESMAVRAAVVVAAAVEALWVALGSRGKATAAALESMVLLQGVAVGPEP
jgi:hypothetical protein